MSLQARLDRIKESFEKEAPQAVLNVFHRVTDDLKASGIVDGILGVGDPAPDFALVDTRGRTTSLASLREKGPVVLTFFRGDW
jgi:hypothetical protein